MITHTTLIPDFQIYADFYGFTPEECLFFDIETTGLSSASASVFLIGTITFSENKWRLTQWMAQEPQEESLILQTFLDIAAEKKVLLHFNGTTFDIPFVRARSQKWNLKEPSEAAMVLEHMQSIDFYQKLKPLKKLYHMERFTQQVLEQFSGWHRDDRLTGKQMIDLYKKYIASKEPKLADLLLLHNHDDLLGMLRILPLTNVLVMMHSSIVSDAAEIKTIYDKQNTAIHFQFTSVLPFPEAITREAEWNSCDCHLELTKTTGTFTIQIYSGELLYFFPDYKNYYYLPAEDQAIHKSIGEFVDREHRQNAKPANCYIRKTGIFLPQIRPLFQPDFQESYKDSLHYFELTDSFLSDQSALMQYLDMMLSCILFNK